MKRLLAFGAVLAAIGALIWGARGAPNSPAALVGTPSAEIFTDGGCQIKETDGRTFMEQSRLCVVVYNYFGQQKAQAQAHGADGGATK